MKKISNLFKKDPKNLGRVINEVNPENQWVLMSGMPTRKFDGTSCAIVGGELYKRFDLKKGRTLPPNAIPCQEEPDIKSGHHPHWVKCERENKNDKWHFVAFDTLENVVISSSKHSLRNKAGTGTLSSHNFFASRDWTYELCGEKVQGNPEKIEGHKLIRHGVENIYLKEISFEYIKKYLTENDIEGIVFKHRYDDRMCKIRKSDFGIRR